VKVRKSVIPTKHSDMSMRHERKSLREINVFLSKCKWSGSNWTFTFYKIYFLFWWFI